MTEGWFGPGRLASAFVLAATAFLSLRPAVDSDYGWHIANGRHLADGVLLGGVDVYSWTAAGATWVAHEWLTEAAMAALHDGIGPAANSVAAAMVVSVAVALTVGRLRRRGIGWGAGLVTAALAFSGTLVSMGVRPQLLELAYLSAALLWLDVRVGGQIGRRMFVAGVAIGALAWSNTHGSFPLLAGVLVIFAVGRLVAHEPDWKDGVLGAALAAVVPLANPWGPALYGFAVQSLTSDVTQLLVQEWRPPALLESSFLPFTAELALAGCGAVLVLRRIAAAPGPARSGRAERPRLDDVFIALAIAVLGLRSGRHVMLFGFAAAPLIALSLETASAWLGARLGGRRSRAAGSTLDPRGRDLVHLGVIAPVLLVLTVVGWSLVEPAAQRRATEARYPTALIDDLDAAAARGRSRLFNEYTWGGFLLMQRPDMRVFIDGRSEVYGDEQLARYAAIVQLQPDWLNRLASTNADVALLPATAPLADALRKAGWREWAVDAVGAVLVRP